MPLVRIDIAKSVPPQVVRAISEVVYEAMTSVANVPTNDRFQVITRHSDDELVYPSDGYLGVAYSPGIVFIQVTWNAGRSVEVKKSFYRAVASGIADKAGIGNGIRRCFNPGRDTACPDRLRQMPEQAGMGREIGRERKHAFDVGEPVEQTLTQFPEQEIVLDEMRPGAAALAAQLHPVEHFHLVRRLGHGASVTRQGWQRQGSI